MNKNYQAGRNFEYRVMRYFEKKGYYCMRSAGSKGQIDVVAIPTEIKTNVDVLLIQCKHGAKISKKEREKLIALDVEMHMGVSCIVAWAKPNSKITFFAWQWQINKSEWGEIKL